MRKIVIILILFHCLVIVNEVKCHTITLTPKLWEKICAINTYWNYKIQYVKDKKHYGKSSYWTFPADDKGDCEDISIAKQYALEKEGIQSYLATCWVRPNKKGYHAVIIVDTDYGTYVLDNRYPMVFHFDDCNYTWDKIERSDGSWRKILS